MKSNGLLELPVLPKAQIKSVSLDILRATIDKADTVYFNGGIRSRALPDEVYDAYKAELKVRAPDDERLFRVGAPISAEGALKKLQHAIPMGSLENAMNLADAQTWYGRCYALRGELGGAVHVSYKMDGGSVSLQYVNGCLVCALTRGDGIEGQNITANAARAKGVSLYVQTPDGKPFSGFVRGEMMLTKKLWLELDPNQESNPRNLCNGIMQRLDGQDCEMLTFFAFRAFDAHGHISAKFARTETELSRWMEALGFIVAPYTVTPAGSGKAMLALRDDYDGMQEPVDVGGPTPRDNLPYEIDGLVLKLDDLDHQAHLGTVSNRPKGQIALKFPPMGAVTKLLSVEYALGTTGTINPVAVLAPVRVGGVTVERASLCNFDEIQRLGIAIGDDVRVNRMADCIPKVTAVITQDKDRKPITKPKKCPVTGGRVGHITKADGDPSVHLYSLDAMDSAPVKIARLERWVRELGILGLGPVYLQALYDASLADIKHLVETPADLYRLEALGVEYLKVEGRMIIGPSSMQAIVAELNKTRKLTLPQIIAAAAPGIGQSRVQEVIDKVPGEFETLTDWLSGKLILNADVLGMPALAKKMDTAIKEVAPLFADLQDAGVEILPVERKKKTGEFVFCLTGKFNEPKDYYHHMIKANGHDYTERFTKQVTHVVALHPDLLTVKMKKAAQSGTPIISPDGMISLMQDHLTKSRMAVKK